MSRGGRIAAAAVAACLAGCAGGHKDDSGSDKASDSGGPDSDEPLEIADPVPMSLLDAAFVAETTDRLGPAAGDAVNDPSGVASASGPYAVPAAILGASGRSASEVQALLGDLRRLMEQTYGPTGLLKGQSVTVPKSTHERLFAVGDGTYLGVELLPADTGFPYGTTRYVPAATGQLAPATRIRFAPAEGGGARVQVSQVRTEGERVTFVQVEYDTAKRFIETTYGATASPDQPGKTLLRTELGQDGRVTLHGAYGWSTPRAATSDAPRYYAPQPDDVELFTVRYQPGVAAESVQELAYLPSGALATAGYAGSSSLFASYGYPRLVDDYLVKTVRDPAVNPQCATYGDALESAFAGTTAPPAVTALPADLCATNAGLTDAALIAALDAACATDRAGSIGLCARHREKLLLANPQLMTLTDGVRRLVAADQATPTHKAFAAELQTMAYPALTALQTLSWEQPANRPAADFAAAKPLP